MPVSFRIPRLIPALLALSLVAAARAQTPPAGAPDPAIAPVVDPAKSAPAAQSDNTPAAPKHDRVMSNAVASTLADGMPKYNPPPKAPEPKPEDEQADLRETNKPRNKIIRLPTYVVKEPKPPVFRDRDLKGNSGMTRLGLKANPGLHIGNIGGLNEPTALLMYEEQERLKNMGELNTAAKDARSTGDSAAADYILKENNRANYRPSDFGWDTSPSPYGK